MSRLPNRHTLILFIALGMVMLPMSVFSQAVIEQVPEGDTQLQGTIRTLNSLINLQKELKEDVKRFTQLTLNQPMPKS